jgi:glutamate formiminotransferase
MKTILDPNFKYVPSIDTDLRKTFARIRREQRSRKQQARDPRSAPDAGQKVVAFHLARKGA